MAHTATATRTDGGDLRFLRTVTTFGTPVDIMVEELSIESLFPADRATPSSCAGTWRAERHDHAHTRAVPTVART